MTMMVSVSGFTPSIRGIGAVGTGSAPHEEQPVATYVDGVYIAAPSAAATFGFNNIQRIEVLKGPQGTLFGRNATGGVIQVVTLERSEEHTSELQSLMRISYAVFCLKKKNIETDYSITEIRNKIND